MFVNTEYGEFECKDITRQERRNLYKEVKEVYASNDIEKLHNLGDKFAIIAFGDEEKADEALKGLSAIEEDVVLSTIITSYMGLALKKHTGD